MSSRFNIENLIVDVDKSFIAANIKELKELATYSYPIKSNEEYRMDLISYSIYNTVKLKWLLIYVNDMIDLSVLKADTIIKYVALEDFMSYLLKSMEKVNA